VNCLSASKNTFIKHCSALTQQ